LSFLAKFDFTLADLDKLNLAFNKAAQISSLMSDYIPIITFALATGSIYALTKFASGVTAELKSSRGADVMATGNFSAGNVQTRGYSDLVQSLANSTVGSVGWYNVATQGVSGGNTDLYNTQSSQVRKYIPGLGNFSGAIDQKTGDLVGNLQLNTGGVIENARVVQTQDGKYEIKSGKFVGYGNEIEKWLGDEFGKVFSSVEAVISDGKVVSAEGIGRDLPAKVRYTIDEKGNETMEVTYGKEGGTSAKLIKDPKTGKWNVLEGKLPISVEAMQTYTEALSKSVAKINTAQEGLEKLKNNQQVDTEALKAIYGNAYQLYYKKENLTNQERGALEQTIRNNEESLIRNLDKVGVNKLEAKEISRDEALTKAGGGVEIGGGGEKEHQRGKKVIDLRRGIIGNLLKLAFGVSFDAEIRKGWATADSYILETADGRYIEIKKSEAIKNALANSWGTFLSGKTSDTSGKSTQAGESKRTDTEYQHQVATVRSSLARFLANRQKQLMEQLNKVQQNSQSVSMDLTRFVVQDFVDQAGGDPLEGMRNLVEKLKTKQGTEELVNEGTNKYLQKIGDEDKIRQELREAEDEIRRETEGISSQVDPIRTLTVEGPTTDPRREFNNTQAWIEGQTQGLEKEHERDKKNVENMQKGTQKHLTSPLQELQNIRENFIKVKNELEALFNKRDKLLKKIEKTKVGKEREKLKKELKNLERKLDELIPQYIEKLNTVKALELRDGQFKVEEGNNLPIPGKLEEKKPHIDTKTEVEVRQLNERVKKYLEEKRREAEWDKLYHNLWEPTNTTQEGQTNTTPPTHGKQGANTTTKPPYTPPPLYYP